MATLNSRVAYKVAATDVRRYSVPNGAQLTIQEGICMRVSEGFMIDGELVLNGQLKVVSDD